MDTAPNETVEMLSIRDRMIPICERLAVDIGYTGLIDKLAEAILSGPIDDFIEQHRALLSKHIDTDRHAEIVMSFVVGWMLGYPGAKATPERAMAMLMEGQIVAAFAAGACSRAVSGAARKRVQ